MRIERLELHSFRNYSDWIVETSDALTILVGPNAAGKTNAIEALELLTTGRSFRRPKWSDLVKEGEESCSATLVAREAGTITEIAFSSTNEGSRSFKLNGVKKRRHIDVVGLIPTVVFTPDDLLFTKGPAEVRRSAIDVLGEQLSKTYGAVRRDYQRALRQRNALLREGAPSPDIEPWTEQLVRLGARLTYHRERLLRRMQPHVSHIYNKLSPSETLTVRHSNKSGLPSVDNGGSEWTIPMVEEAIRSEFERRLNDERARALSLVGPHRDDIVFEICGRDARSRASQGQQRTLALAWKWAEVRVIEDVARKTPVLLLDDVMSELDTDRRRALTDLVQRDIQTFITTTNTGYFDHALLDKASIVTLGEVRTR